MDLKPRLLAHIPAKASPDLIRGGHRFADKSTFRFRRHGSVLCLLDAPNERPPRLVQGRFGGNPTLG